MKFFFLFVTIITVLQSDASKEHCDQLISKGIDALFQKKHSVSLELLSKAKTLSEQNNWYEQQFISTNCIGLNYYQMLDYSEALDYYLEAYTIALKHLNSDREMTVLNNIAVVYLKQGKYKESENTRKEHMIWQSPIRTALELLCMQEIWQTYITLQNNLTKLYITFLLQDLLQKAILKETGH